MKKRVFFLLLAAMMMPFAMQAQVNSSVHIDNTVSACVSYTWSVTGTTYTTSGVYTYVAGDTLYILDLTVNPTYNITVPTVVQGGCTFSWGDSVYTTEGTHTQTFQSVAGCDSTVTINLALATSASVTYEITACESYEWKDSVFTASTVYTMDDNTDTLCDSILTLSLTIIEPEQRNIDSTIVACERIRFRFSPNSSWTTVTQDGYTISTETGNYSTSTPTLRDLFHPRTVDRCYDSVATFHFNIRQKGIERHTERACDEYSITVNDVNYDYLFSKVDTIKAGKAVNGCDSLYILTLTINESPVVYISGDLRVAPGSDATLYANSNQNVAFKWYDNSTSESIVLKNVTSNIDVYVTGTNNNTGCATTSYATVMANAAIGDIDESMISVYPNPTNAIININANTAVKSVNIFNVNGQQVMDAQSVTSINLSHLAKGSYIVRIELADGNVSTRTVVLK